MQIKQILFTERGKALLETVDLDTENLGPTGIIVQSVTSLVSPGTETATFLDLALPDRIAPPPFPRKCGYAHIGDVIAAGDQATVSVGTRVFSMGAHASHVRLDTSKDLVLPVPAGLDPAHAAFTRMAVVSMSTLRTTTARFGDKAAVVGLGLVGNLGAQLAQIAGMETIALDLVEARQDIARRSGIMTVKTEPDEADYNQQQLVMEATGSTGGGMTAAKLARSGGDVSIIGTPWGSGDPSIPAHALLGRIFIGYINVRSGWEWQLPILPNKQFGASSLEHNAKSILGWLSEGRIKVDAILTHQLSPAECGTVYSDLGNRTGNYLGIVWDWTQLPA